MPVHPGESQEVVMGGGGSGKTGKGPESPNFGRIAQQQGEMSRDLLQDQTFANRPDQFGPFGSTTWEYTPGEPVAEQAGGAGGGPDLSGAPKWAQALGGDFEALRAAQGPETGPGHWTQRTGLAEPLQTAADRLMGSLGSQLDPAATRDQAIDSAYRMQSSRLDPRFDAARKSRETQMANEGFTRGDEGWQTAMGEFGRDENDAYQQAMFGAQSGAGNTAFAQSLAANMQPYQQLGAIKGLGASPGFTAAGQADVPQLLAAAMQQYGASLDSFNAGQAGKNSKMNGAASLAPLVLAA
jgi:hypothetical protein